MTNADRNWLIEELGAASHLQSDPAPQTGTRRNESASNSLAFKADFIADVELSGGIYVKIIFARRLAL